MPFLPTLVASLEQHGHLTLTDAVRTQLLAIRPATADRVRQRLRQADWSRGMATTKRGNLLKHQVPVRTFADWSDAKPGFVEADLVAHCGTRADGASLDSLVLTDVATTWTECFALRYRGQDTVIQKLDHARQVLPFPLLGFDTDNGGDFLNRAVIAYGEREQIAFTRGRAYKKNDQCFVEQKNGSVVRQLVGYDRFEGEVAYRQLTELYRAGRLDVNCFQPSMKLQTKRPQGSRVHRTDDAAQTPFQRLLATGVLPEDKRAHLSRVCAALDPVCLLGQVQPLPDARWPHAVDSSAGAVGDQQSRVVPPTGCFNATGCVSADRAVADGDDIDLTPPTPETTAAGRKRRYHRGKKSLGPRT